MIVSLACPFYNEAPGVDAFMRRVVPVLQGLGVAYEIVCVNDGSTDGTLISLRQHALKHPAVRVIDLSRNFGKEAALSAAIDHSRGDAVIIIDADLQDPPELIPTLLERWHAGNEVVLARRRDRSSDSWLKRSTARAFYRLHNMMADRPIPADVGDFRLLDRKVVRAIQQLPERRRFMKGLLSWVGFKTAIVDYVREPRSAGVTKFSAWSLWNLALEGIASFSTAPLRIWTYIGLGVAFFSFCHGLYIIIRTLFWGTDVPGYPSLITIVLFLGGIQLIGLGVLGEYIGRIHAETMQRPLYIVRATYPENVT